MKNHLLAESGQHEPPRPRPSSPPEPHHDVLFTPRTQQFNHNSLRPTQTPCLIGQLQPPALPRSPPLLTRGWDNSRQHPRKPLKPRDVRPFDRIVVTHHNCIRHQMHTIGIKRSLLFARKHSQPGSVDKCTNILIAGARVVRASMLQEIA